MHWRARQAAMRDGRRARFALGASLGLLTLLLPALARAHVGAGDAGLTDGLMHPVFGLDHLLAMVSVGVVSVQLGGGSIWRVPAAFVGAMTTGGVLGFAGLKLPYAELGIAASVVVLGLGIVVAHRSMRPASVIALVMFFGALHGYAHGVEIPGSVSPALYTLGFVLSTATLHIFGVLIGELATLQTWLWRGLRVTGAVVTASGVVFVLQILQGAGLA
jgi:urease accessory protein